MSGIAEVLINQDYEVSGSDPSSNRVTDHLKSLGADICHKHSAENVTGKHVVVISSAISEDNVEVLAAREQSIPVIPRAEMLSELMRMKYGIAIAGTHGKTTTTSLVSTVPAAGDLDPTVIIGGRIKNMGGHAKLGQSKYLIAEKVAILIVGNKKDILKGHPDHSVSVDSLTTGGLKDVPLRDPFTLLPLK